MKRLTFAALAPLFRYPDSEFRNQLEQALAAGRCDELAVFAEEMRRLELAEQQITYTSTFDLAPSCSPYLGVHLFGDESRDRARLMVGLRMHYRGDELPDHIAEVLAFAPAFEDEEWRELGQYVLVPALAKMEAALSDSANPYRHLVAAARQFSEGGEA